MNKYTVNNIFNSEGLPLNEIISEFLVYFLDNEFNNTQLDNLC